MTLAATAREDRDGAAAAGGLSPDLGAALAGRLEALAQLDRTRRRAEVRRLAASLRRVPSDAALPPRAAALLATHVPREVGQRWLAGAPRIRRGFSASASLRASLRRLAAPADPAAETDERAAAARVDADAPAHAARLRGWAARLARGADEARVLGALALGAAGADGGDARSRPWRRIGRELARAWEAPWRG
jgi:hypothetical protein